jgi:DNA-binding NarL/FixJ family response regulator
VRPALDKGTVVIVDPDDEARLLAAQLFKRAGFSVETVRTGEEAVELIGRAPPAAVILEIPLGTLSGYEVVRALREALGSTLPIVFLTGARTEPYDRVAGLLLGADDYMVKPYAPDELLTRVRRLVKRGRPIASSVAERLTKRELEVLQRLAEGLTQAEIADRLYISPKTVATHIENILAKLGVRSRAQAVALAYREELVEGG